MLSTLKKNYRISFDGKMQSIDLDMHAHILPNLDNGPVSIEESLEISEVLVSLGIKQCIVTPHIMTEFYETSEQTIIEESNFLQNLLLEKKIPLKIRPAAEYYVDDNFIQKLKSYAPLLTLDDTNHHILIESSLLNDFDLLKYTIERLIVYGYTPVLAHTEKYSYLFDVDEKIIQLKKLGVQFQVDLSSYLATTQKSHKENLSFLIKNKLIDFLGSNVHSLEHVIELQNIGNNQLFQKTMELPIKNASLKF